MWGQRGIPKVSSLGDASSKGVQRWQSSAKKNVVSPIFHVFLQVSIPQQRCPRSPTIPECSPCLTSNSSRTSCLFKRTTSLVSLSFPPVPFFCVQNRHKKRVENRGKHCTQNYLHALPYGLFCFCKPVSCLFLVSTSKRGFLALHSQFALAGKRLPPYLRWGH